LLLLVDNTKNVLFNKRFPTPLSATPEEIIAQINCYATEAFTQTGYTPDNLSGLGVCIAALVDYENGLIYQAPNLGWHDVVPFKSLLQKSWACPVYLDNDANAAVLGEATYGSARGHRNAIYITISTGIGGGLLLDGRVFRGSSGFAGEVGHMKSFGTGRRCGCGGMDCLEAWASGEAIARNARELITVNGAEINAPTTAQVFVMAQSGNQSARIILDEALQSISTGLANLVTILNPTCVVIGGGVVSNRADYLEQIRNRVQALAVSQAVKVTQVKITAPLLGPEAGVWGMYALMRNEDVV